MSSPDSSNFWKSIQLYLKKPHVVNRRLATVVHLGYCVYPDNIDTLDVADILHRNSPTNLDDDVLHIHSHEMHLTKSTAIDGFLPKDLHVMATESTNVLILAYKLLAKNMKVFRCCYEIVAIDFKLKSVTFICINGIDTDVPPCSAATPPYRVQLCDNNIQIHIPTDDPSVAPKNHQWLVGVLLPKLMKWSDTQSDFRDPSGISVDSHSLVDAVEYNELYNHLKMKYGEKMVETWPEQTDAAKFVYEDVAIATYLLVLWRKERERTGVDRLQSFVDLGCGNGLLVFILSSEGHPGSGIDLRKRGIWDTYPNTTKLEIKAIVPSDSCLFPDVDWIIGNHSDELSPWIPVIAARSAPHVRYFLLPCCAYEFSGAKFQRRNANESQYNDFMRYVQSISDACGFRTQIDRLKIPSTKRVCLIGDTRTTSVDQFHQQCVTIQSYIDSQTKTECADAGQAWSNGFVARSDVELVRNCSKVNRGVQDDIVRKVVEHLLAKRRFLEHLSARWNIGGQASLGELVALVAKDQLKLLKSECGGLQTLLKNNHQIFRVEKGTVQIRAPVRYADRLREVEEQQSKKGGEGKFVFKQKSCWFFDNHPDGCPFDEDDCSFRHFSANTVHNHSV